MGILTLTPIIKQCWTLNETSKVEGAVFMRAVASGLLFRGSRLKKVARDRM